jgi:hypothetical protein
VKVIATISSGLLLFDKIRYLMRSVRVLVLPAAALARHKIFGASD